MIEIEHNDVNRGRELKRLGSQYAPQNQRLIGGVVATSEGPNRVEMVGRTNRLNVWSNGENTAFLSDTALVFQDLQDNFLGGFGIEPNPFNFETPSPRVVLFAPRIGGLAMRGDISPDETGTYQLGYPAFRWSGIFLTTSPNVSSDEKFKDNIKILDKGLEEVKKINPISYDRDGKKHLGFSAQNLQKVLPEIVQEENEELSITPDELVPVLLNAVKQLSEKVEELENKLEKN